MIRSNLHLAKYLGKNGEEILVPKIRTMEPDADRKLTQTVKQNGLTASRKIPNDPRIIASRKWMRRYFVDEILQLPYNVLYKRNMKLVGRRASPEDYWNYSSRQQKRRALKHKPGFIGVHKYDPKRSSEQNERRYFAEKKLMPNWTDIKYGTVILCNIITGEIKGE